MAQSELFAFVLPLIARANASNWARVLDNLHATLNSILNQTAENFVVLLVSDDEIALDAMNDERVFWISAKRLEQISEHATESKVQNHDANRKRALGLRKAHLLGARYVMIADSDDLVSKHLVSAVRRIAPKHGCIVTEGYVMDAVSKRILPFPYSGSGVSSFDRFCGTCSVFTLDEARNDSLTWPLQAISMGHHRTNSLAEAKGRPFDTIGYPAVVYMLNNGTNINKLRDNEQRILNFVDRVESAIQTRGKPINRELMDEFGLLGGRLEK
jgi:hypothetical protein